VVHLTPDITLVVHPIDTDAHTTVSPGWRWAVMVGRSRPDDLDGCANAGWCPTESEACLEGETTAVTVVKALRMLGIPATYSLLKLGHDPIPAGADRLGTPV
jgi:hypothetical protein